MRGNPFTGAHIETPRLLLRPFTESDLSAFVEIASQEDVLKFLPEGDRMTREELEDVFSWLLECYWTNTLEKIRKFTLPIVLTETGEIVGWCGLGPLEYDAAETEIFFVVGREHWGKGFATEAARALLAYAFGPLGLRRVVAVVDPRNRASVAVIGKLGMRPKGTARGLSAEHSAYEGHLEYAIEAGEWPRPKTKEEPE